MTEPTDADTTSRQLRSVAQALDEDKLDRDYFPRVAGLIRETAAERDRLLALVAAQAEQIAELRDGMFGWRKHCYDAWADRDASEAKIARVRALFAGGPDTPCRTVWQDGIECVSVPLDDIRAALDGTEAPA